MFIRLLPNQIPQLWNAIKYAAANADSVEERNLPIYLSSLLVSLLNDKAQCFVRADENRQLLAIVITQFTRDNVTGENELLIRCIYSFKSVSITEWMNDLKAVTLFAIRNKCKRIVGYSSNNKMFELANELGFTEHYRYFVMEV